MTDRNRYAAPKVPVADAPPPENVFANGIEDVEYGGFWRRFVAQLLDGLILLPVALLVIFGPTIHLFHVYFLVPELLIELFYSVYLVQRFGGTPGKLIMGLRIVMTDGWRITPSAALRRYSVFLVISMLQAVAMAMVSLGISAEDFDSLGGYGAKLEMFEANVPFWADVISYAFWIWIVACAIVMLSNKRRRATHDFIANTLVVRT